MHAGKDLFHKSTPKRECHARIGFHSLEQSRTVRILVMPLQAGAYGAPSVERDGSRSYCMVPSKVSVLTGICVFFGEALERVDHDIKEWQGSR